MKQRREKWLLEQLAGVRQRFAGTSYLDNQRRWLQRPTPRMMTVQEILGDDAPAVREVTHPAFEARLEAVKVRLAGPDARRAAGYETEHAVEKNIFREWNRPPALPRNDNQYYREQQVRRYLKPFVRRLKMAEAATQRPDGIGSTAECAAFDALQGAEDYIYQVYQVKSVIAEEVRKQALAARQSSGFRRFSEIIQRQTGQ